jgi:hypothetical protein
MILAHPFTLRETAADGISLRDFRDFEWIRD